MCSVKNVNSHASLTISCIVNCRQSQYFQIVGGPKSNYGDKMMVTVADPGKGGGAEKHEIYAAAFGGHIFYDLFLQGQGGPWPPRPPWIRYWVKFW